MFIFLFKMNSFNFIRIEKDYYNHINIDEIFNNVEIFIYPINEFINETNKLNISLRQNEIELIKKEINNYNACDFEENNKYLFSYKLFN